MLSRADAIAAVQKQFPDCKVEFYLNYKGLILVKATSADPEEGDYDPFYSVNPQTGDVQEFSVMTDANPVELSNLWLAQQEKES